MHIATFTTLVLLIAPANAQTSEIKDVPLTLQEFNKLWQMMEDAPVPHRVMGPMELILQEAATRATSKGTPQPPAPSPQP